MFGRYGYLYVLGLALVLPFLSLAAVQSATIITRPGVATAPLKYYFDLSSALAEGINQNVKITISASNAEKTAVRFDSVQLFDQSGVLVGRNVASKTDALTATPYAFVFQNFGVPASELGSVAGVQMTFIDLGGENSTGKVTVQNVAVSVNRESGDQCIIVDPFIEKIPPPPPPNIVAIQTERPLVRPGTRGGGSSGGSPASQGPNSPGTMADDSAVGSETWVGVDSAKISDDVTASVNVSAGTRISHYLRATNFGFSVPASATINGIIVSVERRQGSFGTVTDNRVRIIKGGAIGSTDNSIGSGWSTTDTVVAYGSSSYIWGETWTASDINNSGFGFALSVIGSGAQPTTADVDHITTTVHYTEGGASAYDALRDLTKMVRQRILDFLRN